jgi:hypothetical protein
MAERDFASSATAPHLPDADHPHKGLFGPDYSDLFRRAGDYVDKILKGAKPADIPVELPTRIELVVNLKTAKAIELKIPETFLVRADEVIE